MAGTVYSEEWHALNKLIEHAGQIMDINDALRHAERGPLRDLGHDKIRELAAALLDGIDTERNKYEREGPE